jgi:hypothetical protein
VNYDESEEEEDVELNSQSPNPLLSSAVLPIEEDDEVDLCSDELGEEVQGDREGSQCKGRGGWRRWRCL